jgi:hypothetical protein
MTLEETVTVLLRGPVRRFAAAYSADPSGWYVKLKPEEQAELLLGSMNGIFDAITAVARAIDQLDGST